MGALNGRGAADADASGWRRSGEDVVLTRSLSARSVSPNLVLKSPNFKDRLSLSANAFKFMDYFEHSLHRSQLPFNSAYICQT